MGVRTPDLLNAIEALYQLSYDPVIREGGAVLPPIGNNQVPSAMKILPSLGDDYR